MSNLLIGVIAILVAVAGVQTWRLDRAQSELQVTDVQLQACGARLTNLIEDLEADNEIDNLPDSALTDVPPEWLLPPREN